MFTTDTKMFFKMVKKNLTSGLGEWVGRLRHQGIGIWVHQAYGSPGSTILMGVNGRFYNDTLSLRPDKRKVYLGLDSLYYLCAIIIEMEWYLVRDLFRRLGSEGEWYE